MMNRPARFRIPSSSQSSRLDLRLTVAALFFAIVVVGCSRHKATLPAEFLPATNSVPGWVKSSNTRTFEATRLWEYIDGDADKYVQAGVLEAITSDYRFKSKTEATADVYVMGSPAGAQKVYDSESAQGSQPLALGDAGRSARGMVTFRQGSYFVRIVAYGDWQDNAPALSELARAVSQNLSSLRKP